jgi:hypothetical protein
MQTPASSSEPDNDLPRKAQVFFERGDTIAQTGNFEFAVDLYIQGLALDPDNAVAHEKLRAISLKRKAVGGKAMGIIDKMKLPRAKDAKTRMLNAEKLLAYEPGSTDHMSALAEAAREAKFNATETWIEGIARSAPGNRG